jgi:hypothetical protein
LAATAQGDNISMKKFSKLEAPITIIACELEKGGFFGFFLFILYAIQHCIICHHHITVLADNGMKVSSHYPPRVLGFIMKPKTLVSCNFGFDSQTL